eukprot:CAMPEP_0115555398 /NCGR_PEP_ID=MMETSP0271-20121206/97805_1 /TAXON_ID=71861 /ORGANISM="Scrippsiella trochoidea, Strain CCMP3099" /LENGTH=90 /DNA_ID=CAMNT_0002989187 /DNA_START=99 /DNA_END=368 /DNA_ORIENTATION=+
MYLQQASDAGGWDIDFLKVASLKIEKFLGTKLPGRYDQIVIRGAVKQCIQQFGVGSLRALLQSCQSNDLIALRERLALPEPKAPPPKPRK